MLTACSASTDNHLERQPPKSWAEVDVKNLNARIDKAAAAEESWTTSPLLSVIHLLGDDSDARSVVIEEMKNRGEGADEATITCIHDGLMDDSVRGTWREVVLRRLPDGTWRISEARAAYRCWRAEDRELFQGSPCP
jgi:hypothetical protein